MPQTRFTIRVIGMLAALLLAAVPVIAAPVIFAGHTNGVYCVAYSHDGAKVLTGSFDDTAQLWDAATGANLQTFTGHTSDVYGVAFSPDGTMVLTGSDDHTARLWNAATGLTVRTLTGHTSAVGCVAYSPNGAEVLTGSDDMTARLWDAATGLTIRTFTGHTGEVYGVAFSPDGTKVLTGSLDRTAILWDAATGTALQTFSGHLDGVTSVALSPGGATVLTGSFDASAILWDASSGTQIQSLIGHTDAVSSVEYSPDGTKALTGSWDYTTKLWDTSSGAVLNTLGGHTDYVNGVAFSPDGTKALIGSSDGTATLEIAVLPITGGVIINYNATSTNNRNADLSITWSGGFGMGVTDMRFSDDGVNWTPWQTVAITAGCMLPAPDGVKTVRVQFRDSMGGMSPVFSDSILLDTTPPTGKVLVNKNATFTKTPTVTLSLTYTDGSGKGVAGMRFSNKGSAWSAWLPAAATAPFTLQAPDGAKKVQVQFRDLLGNVSAVYSDSIVLDTTRPTGTIRINNNAPTTTTPAVTLNLGYTDGTGTGVRNMRFSDNGSTWTAWEPVKATRLHTLPAGLGNHTVRVQYSDGAGNYSLIYSDYIRVM